MTVLDGLHGLGRVRTGRDIDRHLTDPRGTIIGVAACVLVPETVAQVQAIVQHAVSRGLSLIPQGGNTGLVAAGIGPDPDSVILSLERLNHITIDAAGNAATVGAGAILANVRDAAARNGRLFPLSLGAQGTAQIGGLMSTNAGGVSVLKYGMMRDLVLGIEVVLPDGSLLRDLNSLRKNNVGYDLKHLFIGAEGTLGIITAAVLKLVAQPHRHQTAVVAVPSARAALDLFHLVNHGCAGLVSAFEYITPQAIALAEKHLGLRAPCSGPGGELVLVDLDLPAGLDGTDILESVLSQPKAAALWDDAVIATSESQRAAFWNLRESLPEACWREGPGVSHDVSVPLGAIPAFLDGVRAGLGDGWRTVVYGHMGDGNIHYSLLADDHSRAEVSRATATIYDRALDLSGSFSAEHGIGRRKLDLAQHRLPARSQQLRRQIKDLLDPTGAFNPGALFPTRPRQGGA